MCICCIFDDIIVCNALKLKLNKTIQSLPDIRETIAPTRKVIETPQNEYNVYDIL